MKSVKIFKLNPEGIIPDYAHRGDAGMDLYSIEDTVIPSGKYKIVKTGIAIEIPKGFEAQIRSKSGIAVKNGVFVLNSPGTIDECYRGELGVILCNLGERDYFIKKGEKIAQMVFNKVEYLSPVEVNKLSSTERGEGGFGSTGLKKKA